MGDLDPWDAYRAFVRDVDLYQQLFGITPQVIVHDLHPDYESTNYARQRGGRAKTLRLLPVQHHHAHMASCMAEHGLNEPVIGVSFDGTGYGTDGAIWGGEFLVGDYTHFRRAAHLRYVRMPGADKAIREPWRMAFAHVRDADCAQSPLDGRIPATTRRTLETMLDRGFNAPQTSSAGRLFDAVASLVGIRATASVLRVRPPPNLSGWRRRRESKIRTRLKSNGLTHPRAKLLPSSTLGRSFVRWWRTSNVASRLSESRGGSTPTIVSIIGKTLLTPSARKLGSKPSS